MFSVYLGNIPADVVLEEVWINGRRMLTAETPDQGFSISPVIHMNGSGAYELQLPFEDPAVDWTVRLHPDPLSFGSLATSLLLSTKNSQKDTSH